MCYTLRVMKRRNTKGFTLGEVLLVVAIISALTAIGIPSLMKEIDKAKLRVDQAHVQEAVSMATSQYAADHESVTVVYYYDANRSEIQKENRNIYGYGKSTKEPYKHNTHVTDSTVPVNDDGTRNLVRVTVTKQSGEFSIESSWVPAAVNGETPPPTSTPVTTPDPNKKTFGDVEITAAGDWLLQQNVKENETRYYTFGHVYQFQGDSKYYLVIDTGVGGCTNQWSATPNQNNALDMQTLDFSKVYTYKGLQDYAKAHDVKVPLWTPVISDDRKTIYLCKNESVVNESLTNKDKFVPVYGAALKADAKPIE